jgi:NAD+ synthase (glutamine-hydrolysing)
MVMDKEGKIIAQARSFETDLLYVELDTLRKSSKEKKENSKEESPVVLDHQKNFYALEEKEETISDLHDAIIMGIRDFFERAGFKKAYIGLSGGIDSAVVATLAKEALGRKNITGVSMPSILSSEQSYDDAFMLSENLGINFLKLPIKDINFNYESLLRPEFNNKPRDITEENIQARIRGIILMALANKNNALVLSTGNKTETALGYSTLYGDMCGALSPISDVSKLEVYRLAALMNKETEVIPVNIIARPPTAELSKGQSDEISLGAPYKLISPLVDDIVVHGKSRRELEKKYPKDTITNIINLI